MLCTVLSNSALRPGAFDLRVKPLEAVRAARPGQFAQIACGAEHFLRRPISLCDQTGEELRFVYEVKGSGTIWLSRRAPGDTVDILFPLGSGFAVPKNENLLLVGGGLGVPPMLLCARRAEKAHAVLGFRSAALAILTGEFPCPTTLMTDDGSLGQKGFVDAAVRDLLKSGGFHRVLACGPKVMLRAVASAAQEFGVPCSVSMEERMACGVGACLVCACKTKTPDGETYSQVCRQGPVFDASEVVW